MSFSRHQRLLVLAGILLLVGGCRKNYWPGPDVIDADAPSEITQTSSGLRYRILRRTSGKRPKPQSKIRVHYRGWLDDAEDQNNNGQLDEGEDRNNNGKLDDRTVFDSSYEPGLSKVFIVEQTIPGWIEGLQYVGEGGMIELEIPAELAYGEKGSLPLIPANATLLFRIELLHVE